MSLTPGSRIGPYDVVAPLGAGGMGEVYRARDTQLDRDVAIKILPDLFAADPDRLMRFEREAKTLAALNHPNIAQIHGVEQREGKRALVMELVDGEDLAQRIARGPLPLDEALPIARQIAEALEAAHEAGIIHRDLKPANIKVRGEGTVKVLDFGLAKSLEPAVSSDPGMPAVATVTSPALTQLGVILGTAAYMAPEQARGKAVDKRVDIWAFGCVLYEMLTGRNAFAGETVTDTLAAVMTRSPELSLVPAATPASVRRLLARCLERDPKRRLRDIGEARIALADDPAIDAPAPSAARTRSRGRAFAWAAATLAIAVATGVIVWQLRSPAALPERRFTIPIPGDGTAQAAAIAPDGSAVAFIADDRLWLQRLDQFTPSEVDGARGARAVFWSPDSAFLGFQARGQLWKVAAAGGVPLEIGRVSQDFTRAGGAAWLDDGRIVFTTGGTGLLEIPAGGGTARPLLDIDPAADADFHNVSALPGGRGLLYVRHPTAVDTDYSIEVYVPSDGTRRALHATANPFSPVYSGSGHILYQQAGSVWMLPFALDRLEVTGDAVRVQASAVYPSVANDGTLVMVQGQGSGETRLTWADRTGNAIEDLGQPAAPILDVRISPDGRFAAATLGAASASNIWIFDVARGTQRQLTFEAGRNASPVWTPNGQHIVYVCDTSLCGQPADGSGAPVELLDAVVPVSRPAISPDGTRLLFVRESAGTGPDLWMADLGPNGPTAPVTSPRPLLTTIRDQFNPAVSPDGRFVAYVSSEVGQYGVYVSRFPDGAGKWVVSSGFGAVPTWGARGDRLYFVGEGGRIVEREVGVTPSFEVGKVLSEIRIPGLAGNGFDVAADGQRFLVPRSAGGEDQAARLLVVQNRR